MVSERQDWVHSDQIRTYYKQGDLNRQKRKQKENFRALKILKTHSLAAFNQNSKHETKTMNKHTSD